MMANHTCHFKIGVFGDYLLERDGPDYLELQGLFDFLVRGMRCTYDPILKEDGRELDNLMNLSEIDIAMVQMGVTKIGVKELNLNYPFSVEEVTFAVRNPEYSPRIGALFQTLSPTVWLSWLASTILFALVSYVVLKHRRTLADVLLHVIAVCLNQEGNIVSRRAGEFILLCTWMVAMALFTLCFKSVLLSFLSFPPLNTVRTVPELAAAIRDGEYIAFSAPFNPFPKILSQSPNEDIRLIAESMNKSIRRYAEYMFAEHFLENYSAFPKKAHVHFRTHMSIPGVYISKDNLFTLISATYVRKDFWFKEEMDMLVHRFLASGIDTKIRNFREFSLLAAYTWAFQKHNVPVEVPEEDKLRKLSLTDLGGAFVILAVGHFLSFCVLIIELMVKRREASLSKKKTITSP